MIRQADAHEQLTRDRLTHAAWGARLSVDEYVGREERLRRHAFAAGLRSWLWVDGSDVLASCETYAMRSFLDGKEGSTLGIASVFVEPELRGRGYATLLLSELHVRLDDERPHALILFSEVGADIYSRLGYAPRAVDAFMVPAAGDFPAGVEHITDDEVAGVLAEVKPPAAPFVVWPTAAQLDWHRERERIYSTVLDRPALVPAGARVGADAVFWAADWKSGTLYLTLLSAPHPLLISAAQAVARASGLLRVVGWQKANVGEPYDASDSLAMIRPVAPALTSDGWTTIPRGVWV